jgi:hypothetical protein
VWTWALAEVDPFPSPHHPFDPAQQLLFGDPCVILQMGISARSEKQASAFLHFVYQPMGAELPVPNEEDNVSQTDARGTGATNHQDISGE